MIRIQRIKKIIKAIINIQISPCGKSGKQRDSGITMLQSYGDPLVDEMMPDYDTLNDVASLTGGTALGRTIHQQEKIK